jgi:hypothetical protein
MPGSTTNANEQASFSFKNFVLGGLIALCILLIGTVGYAKYQMDRAEAVLAAPDSSLTADQDLYERTLHALGYGGFLGAAQTFIATKNDPNALQDMKQDLKTAQEGLNRIGDKGSASVRHDIESILNMFTALKEKAEKSSIGEGDYLSAADLLPAATAMPMLDSRLQAALATNRLAAQGVSKYWSLVLTALAWLGFILASILATMLIFARRNRHIEPLHNLVKSIDHIARSDLQTPVWGVERQDVIGELARAMDLARQRFGQIPDITLMSDQGPVRMKFDGESRSLFQALTRSMRDDYERSKTSATGFASAMAAQQELLSSLIARLNEAFLQIQRTGVLNESAVKQLEQSLSNTTKIVAQAQDRALAQIEKVIPFLQDRAQNMAEITSLAGTQVTQSLSSLLSSEKNMRSQATQSQQVITQLANTTNQLGERLFAAVNLMQASGKALNEVTDSAQSRFNEAVETLGRGEGKLQNIIDHAESRLKSTVNAEENMAALAARTETSAERMEVAVRSIAEKHERLSEQTVLASKRMETILASFDGAQRAMSEAVVQLKRDGGSLGDLLQDLRSNNDDLLKSVAQNSLTSHTSVQSLTERSQALMQRLEVQIAQQAQAVETKIDELMMHGRTISQQSQATTSGLAQTIEALRAEEDKIATTRARFTDMMTEIGSRLEDQANTAFGKTEQWAEQSYTKLASLAEQMESVVQRLSILGQLTGTLGSVAGQLGQLVPALTQTPLSVPTGTAQAPVQIGMPSTEELSDALSESLAGTLSQSIGASLVQKIQNEMHQAVVQIEAMHDQLAQMVVAQKDQLETRLIVMDKKLKDSSTTDSAASDPRQTAIIGDIVNTLAKINEHVLQLDETIQQNEESRREA